MLSSGTILSGSAALSIILPGSCKPGDLNFYCPVGSLAIATNHFINNGEYAEVNVTRRTLVSQRTRHSSLDVNNGVRSVHKFRHLTTCRFVTLTESISESPLLPLFYFHTTLMMNCVTGGGAICFYPDLTYHCIGRLNPCHNFDKVHKPGSVAKWTDSTRFKFLEYRRTQPIPGLERHTESHGIRQRASRRSNDEWLSAFSYGEADPWTGMGPTLRWRLGIHYTWNHETFLHGPTKGEEGRVLTADTRDLELQPFGALS
ncbi:hypothetical protein DFP72DRAFT_855550 [Ephemerocybe angulata]|uniref:Uncharacterized protein n=1 Tax=Ephemerocybe angulata TaxID=980116 RepID=A0A8H6HH53_9AGAR|nr:hypothetical protein DFP72DRAFT_855550 [Tulosesus angulatus]